MSLAESGAPFKFFVCAKAIETLTMTVPSTTIHPVRISLLVTGIARSVDARQRESPPACHSINTSETNTNLAPKVARHFRWRVLCKLDFRAEGTAEISPSSQKPVRA